MPYCFSLYLGIILGCFFLDNVIGKKENLEMLEKMHLVVKIFNKQNEKSKQGKP
jgi:hypothetical protein